MESGRTTGATILTAVLCFSGIAATAEPATPRVWEDPSVFDLGQKEPHATLMPFSAVSGNSPHGCLSF